MADWEEINNRLLKENKELKSMLKQVADDIEKFQLSMKMNKCYIYCIECIFNNGVEECGYKRMNEIKKLIGE